MKGSEEEVLEMERMWKKQCWCDFLFALFNFSLWLTSSEDKQAEQKQKIFALFYPVYEKLQIGDDCYSHFN